MQREAALEEAMANASKDAHTRGMQCEAAKQAAAEDTLRTALEVMQEESDRRAAAHAAEASNLCRAREEAEEQNESLREELQATKRKLADVEVPSLLPLPCFFPPLLLPADGTRALQEPSEGLDSTGHPQFQRRARKQPTE